MTRWLLVIQLVSFLVMLVGIVVAPARYAVGIVLAHTAVIGATVLLAATGPKRRR